MTTGSETERLCREVDAAADRWASESHVLVSAARALVAHCRQQEKAVEAAKEEARLAGLLGVTEEARFTNLLATERAARERAERDRDEARGGRFPRKCLTCDVTVYDRDPGGGTQGQCSACTQTDIERERDALKTRAEAAEALLQRLRVATGFDTPGNDAEGAVRWVESLPDPHKIMPALECLYGWSDLEACAEAAEKARDEAVEHYNRDMPAAISRAEAAERVVLGLRDRLKLAASGIGHERDHHRGGCDADCERCSHDAALADAAPIAARLIAEAEQRGRDAANREHADEMAGRSCGACDLCSSQLAQTRAEVERVQRALLPLVQDAIEQGYQCGSNPKAGIMLDGHESWAKRILKKHALASASGSSPVVEGVPATCGECKHWEDVTEDREAGCAHEDAPDDEPFASCTSRRSPPPDWCPLRSRLGQRGDGGEP